MLLPNDEKNNRDGNPFPASRNISLSAVIRRAVEQGVTIALAARPRPSCVTFEQAAEMLGVSSRTVSGMVRKGVIGTNKVGRIPITEIDKALSATFG